MRTTPSHDAERRLSAWSPAAIVARATGLPRFVAGAAVSATLFHVLFVGGVTIIKSSTNALFLSRADPTRLPLLYAAVAVVVTLATTALARLLVTRPLRQLQIEATIGGAVLVLAACVAVQLGGPEATAAAYVIGEATATCGSVMFWSRLMDGFTSRDQKRVVGLVAGGGMAGAALGGLLVRLVVGSTGVVVLMAFAAVLWIVALPLLNSVRARSTQSEHDAHDANRKPAPAHQQGSGGMSDALRYLLARGYPRVVALLVVLLAATGAASDFVFRAAAARTASETDMAALFGMLNAVVGVVVVVLQVGLTARFLQKLGVFVFAGVVPALLLLFAGAHAVFEHVDVEVAFFLLVTLKGVEMAGAYSLHPAVVALLYNPMPPEVRAQARTLIDGAIKKTGAAVAGLVLGLLAVQGAVSVWTVFVAAGLTLLLLPVLRMHYVDALAVRLSAPRQKKVALGIDPSDRTTRHALEKGLASDDADDVLHALEALGPHYVLQDALLLRLLEHNNERVRTAALARVPARPDRVLAARLLVIALTPGARRPRAEAVRALARVQPGRAADVVLGFLDDEEPGVVCAALEVALRSREDKVARARLDQLVDGAPSLSLAWRRELARLLGALSESRYTPALALLIDDVDDTVRTLAIDAAAKEGDPAHVPHLVRRLDDRRTRAAVAEALVRFGDRAVAALSAALDDTSLPLGVRVHVPRLLQRVGSESAAHALLFSNTKDNAFLQSRIASALSAIVAAKPGINVDKKRTDEAIGRRLIGYAAYDDALKDLMAGGHTPVERAARSGDDDDDERALKTLCHVIDVRRRQNLGIALDLLGLHRGQDKMARVRQGLFDGGKQPRLDAIELLDAALTADPLRADFLSLLDVSDSERSPARVHARAFQLTASKDPLIRGVARVVIRRLGDEGEATNPGLPGAVELQGEDMADDLVERLFILEDVDLFTGLAFDDLLAIAAIASERTVERGELLYKEGDGGTELFVIVDGSVELTRQGTAVMTLRAGESAGQVSFLDRGPRPVTARVSEKGAARFLVVEREAFVDLMSDRTSLMHAFLDVLASRLRTLIEKTAG
ncbi:MAG: cyclic nucleotide-binding domain-containing protein [Deltaproteobacteria bacterium]|nr:cyclic nucleotide-binding domain-containing protein [Deltaproteobacteria bacterium]